MQGGTPPARADAIPTGTLNPASVMSGAHRALRLISQNPITFMGLLMVTLVVLVAIFAPLLANHDPYRVNPLAAYQAPSSKHWFGTDHVGMDVYSRVVFAARTDLSIAFFATLISMLIGVPLGVIAGYKGGLVETLIMRTIDGVNAFPAFVLAMLIVAALGQGIFNIIIVIGFVNSTLFTRLVRAEVLALKESDFIEAARCVGNPTLSLMFRHLVPNAAAPILVTSALNASWAIWVAAGLSFIGVGVPIPTAEWGLMINVGSESLITGEWWMSVFPGLAIVFTVLGFNLLADGLQTILDPRQRER